VDAKIAAINTGTNLRYETTSNSSGEYYLVNLPPDRYRLEIEKPGFKKSDTPRVAGGLVSGAASKAVVPSFNPSR